MNNDVGQVTAHAGAAIQRACIWCGPLVVAICAVGMLLPGFVPPPGAFLTADETRSVFEGSTTAIRVGMLLMVIGGAFIGAFFAAISAQLRRIEGPRPILTYLQLLLGACFVMEIIFPVIAVQTAAFRPERSGVLQQTLNDMAWLAFFGIASTGIVQWVIIGVAILQDTRRDPIFPRWSAYFNIWAGLMLVPGTFVVFFKTGPMSWTGLFVFWLPFAAFFAWLMVMTWLLLRAVTHESAEATATANTSDALGAAAEERLSSMGEQMARLDAELQELRHRVNQPDGHHPLAR